MVVIGIDPGSQTFGIGIVKKEAQNYRYLYSEAIRLREKDFSSRMKILWNRLDKILSRFPLEGAAMEEVFLGKNVRSLSLLSTVRGIAMGALLAHNIPVKTYSPRTVKQTVTSNGNATKPQVNRMVKILLNIRDRKLGLDESDALAVACCHLLMT